MHCCVRWDWHTLTKNLQRNQELLSAAIFYFLFFLPIWIITSYTQSYMESKNWNFAHTLYYTPVHISPTCTSKTKSAYFFCWFIQYVCASFRAGRQMCCLSASRVHAKAACLGWVWLKNWVRKSLVEVITSRNTNEAFAPVMALPNENTNPHALNEHLNFQWQNPND